MQEANAELLVDLVGQERSLIGPTMALMASMSRNCPEAAPRLGRESYADGSYGPLCVSVVRKDGYVPESHTLPKITGEPAATCS